MSKNLKYHVALSIKDQASSGIKKAIAEMQKGETKMAQSHKRFSEARKNLSIRSDKEIQREIQRTEASYNRLARAGFKSANEQQRAYKSMQSQVQKLNQEMERTNSELGKTSKFGNAFKNMKIVGGGLVAGATVGINRAKEPIQQYISFDEQLAHGANTAFSDLDITGRNAGKETLKTIVKNAIQEGGTKEDALAGINKLLAADMDIESVKQLAPIIQKTATAANATTEEISDVVIALLGIFQVSIEEIPKALDMALKGGQLGTFELQDMARWLPKQLSAAKSMSGMKGLQGFGDVITMNEQAANMAGTADDAGNYVYSFLLSMNDQATRNAFANSSYKEGDKKGIDLTASMLKGIENGLSPLESFMGIMDTFIGKDADYQAILKEISLTDGKERSTKLEQSAEILEGSKIAQIFGNRNALMGFLSLRSQAEYGAGVRSELESSDGTVNKSWEVIADTASFKVRKEEENRSLLNMEAYAPVAEAYASLSKTLDEHRSKYPELNKSLTLATDALIVFGTAAAGMAVLGKLFGRGGGGFDVPWGRPQTTVPSTQSPTGRPPAPTGGGSGIKNAAMFGLRWAPLAGEAYALYEGSKDDVGNIINKHDGFTPEAAGEITETGYEKTIKPIVDTVSAPFLQAFNSLVNAIPGLRDDPNATIPGLIDMPYQIPTIGQRMDAIANNPDYQPYSIGPEVMQLMERTLETIEQQQNPAQQAPTVIQLQVTGEMDGRQIMEIVEQHTIDMMNRGSKN